MNKIHITSAVLLALLALGCGKKQQGDSGAVTLENQMDSVSYSLGKNIGTNIHKEGIDSINIDLFQEGMQAALEERDSLLTKEEAMGVIQSFFSERQKAKTSKEAETNAKKAESFLAENKQKEGIKTTESGLQYKVLKKGDGPKPDSTDRVRVHYKGQLLDSTVFDNSYERGEPATFQVSRVVPGWTEALQKMRVGSKWRIFLPPELGYGRQGAGNVIPPNAMLIFDMELLKIVEKPAPGDQKQAF